MSKKKKEDHKITEPEKQNKDNSENNKLDFHKGFSPSPEKNIPFPATFTTDPRVYIEEDVYKEIQAHSTETTSVELCGVLIGEVRFDVLGNYLYVCGSIRGDNAKNSRVNVSFIADTWVYINKISEDKYPDYSIIGWYHTHPGFGIFLSDMDKFIQDYFFNMPYQIAMVVDPKASQNGIFAWQDGKIRPLKKCWAGKELISLTIGTVGGEETYIETDKTDDQVSVIQEIESSDKEESDNSIYKHYFYYFLCINIGLLLANLFYIRVSTNAGTVAAQHEARDIITSWAMEESISNELSETIMVLEQYVKNADNYPATATIDLNSVKQFNQFIANNLRNVYKKSKAKSDSALNLLKKISNRNIDIQANAEEQMLQMKEMVATSILIQLEPYLTSLSAQPVNETILKEARKTLEYILNLYPAESQKAVKERYPWIFQN